MSRVRWDKADAPTIQTRWCVSQKVVLDLCSPLGCPTLSVDHSPLKIKKQNVMSTVHPQGTTRDRQEKGVIETSEPLHSSDLPREREESESLYLNQVIQMVWCIEYKKSIQHTSSHRRRGNWQQHTSMYVHGSTSK